MENRFSRSALLIGDENIKRLKNVTVAVFGLGGVGSYAAEALARSGIGSFVLIDHDKVSVTNVNRQLIASSGTIGRQKTDVMKERILSINPQAQVKTFEVFCLPENAAGLIHDEYDYIADAIDTVSGKIALVEESHKRNIPIISSMGAGNKMNPTEFQTADIYETSVCPLCRVMRKELKKRNIPTLKVVYSKEPPLCLKRKSTETSAKRQIPGSMSFVPPVAGLIIAGEIVKDLIGWNHK